MKDTRAMVVRSLQSALGSGVRPICTAGTALLLAACKGVQSSLDPAGPRAERIADLWWVMFWLSMAVWALVSLLLAYAYLRARRRSGNPPSDRSLIQFVLWFGAILPAVVLAGLTVLDVMTTKALLRPARPTKLTIEVTGLQWWWRVQYSGAEANRTFRAANEIRVPVGRPVEMRLKSADVIHSFWAPALSGKLDMIPGKTNRFWIEATKPGIYRGQCAEYCGAEHALMAFYVVAMEPEAFEVWLEKEAQPALEPALPRLKRGKALFLASGCGACHTVRGTPAEGLNGPDLTHIGSRMSIGAGILPNTQATLAGWIASAQHIKPESRMPSFDVFEGEDLRAIAAYLESLK